MGISFSSPFNCVHDVDKDRVATFVCTLDVCASIQQKLNLGYATRTSSQPQWAFSSHPRLQDSHRLPIQ